MELRTKIKLTTQQKHQIDHQSKVLLLGSCFSKSIGNKLSYYQFDTLINPFGVLFSPTAIAKVLKDTVEEKVHQPHEVVKQREQYHSLHHHSNLSALSVKEVLNNIQKAQKNCLLYLQNATHVVITLGTSWVYQYKETGVLVANCHKIPATAFEKKILAVDEVAHALVVLILAIRKVNPSVQIIFTVSPVRHTKGGLIENSQSKAHLLSAIWSIKQSHNVAYFASYEMMVDDLRDYRFYKADLIHPNELAVAYIWEQFSIVWIAKKSQNYFKRIAAVQQGKLHKPFHEDSVSHQEFLKKMTKKQQQLESELNIKFDA